jgi:pilus assembly protein CpaB
MFKKRGLVLVLLSVVLAGGAAWVANKWIQDNMTPVTAETNLENNQVATAAIGIPYGTKVDARHVKMVPMPESSIPSGAIIRIADVEGKIATAEMLPGEMLLRQRFVDHESGSTLAALVEKKMRAVTVRVDDVIGVGGFLLPGNYVDVLASRLERGSRRAITETVLRNVKVLAVDQTAKTDENDPVVVRAVTLEVSPKQAEELVKRMEEGTIQLTLRNPLDTMVAEEVVPEPAPAPKKVIRRIQRAPTDTEMEFQRNHFRIFRTEGIGL